MITSVGISRCMYHVLVIQLHHPLLARGDSFTTPPADAPESLATCAAAATEIVRLLMAYDRTFTVRKAPYLIAYATYVSATIHVRMAGLQVPTSDTSPCLRTCLGFLNQNRETNPGVDNAKASLIRLMNRMGVVCQEEPLSSGTRSGRDNRSSSGYASTESSVDFPLAHSSPERSRSRALEREMTSNNAIVPDGDMDGILQSFADGHLSTSPSSTSLSSHMLPTPYQPSALPLNQDFQWSNAYDTSLFDPVGMDYSQAGVGGAGGEGYDNYTGLVDYGGPMQYTGSLSTFGR